MLRMKEVHNEAAQRAEKNPKVLVDSSFLIGPKRNTLKPPAHSQWQVFTGTLC